MDLKRLRPFLGRFGGTAEPPAPEQSREIVPVEPDQADAAPAHAVAPVVVPRWVQMVLLPLAILGGWLLIRAAGYVFLVLVVAGLVALLLNPLVQRLEHVMPRGLAIPMVYLGLFLTLVLIGVALATPISNEVSGFANRVPSLIKKANKDLANLQTFLNKNGIKVKIQQQGQTALHTLQHDVLKSSSSIVSFARDLLGKVVSITFDLVLIFVLSIYMLVYAKQIGALVRRIMPPGDGTPLDDFPMLAQRAVAGYVRGQLLFSLIMGTSVGLALWIFGMTGVFPDGSRYTLTFAVFYGLAEFIPYVGPIIGPAPAVIVALLDDPFSAVWLLLLFVTLQQLEGHIVAPQVFRISLRINPIIIILALLIGDRLYGIAGSLIALPCAAVIRVTVVYLKHHLALEPWHVKPAGGGGGPGAGVIAMTPDQCPDCGARPTEGDAFCRGCGTSLEPRVTTPG